jgi:hypothetical protein
VLNVCAEICIILPLNIRIATKTNTAQFQSQPSSTDMEIKNAALFYHIDYSNQVYMLINKEWTKLDLDLDRNEFVGNNLMTTIFNFLQIFKRTQLVTIIMITIVFTRTMDVWSKPRTDFSINSCSTILAQSGGPHICLFYVTYSFFFKFIFLL